jgi:hypothetical protein
MSKIALEVLQLVSGPLESGRSVEEVRGVARLRSPYVIIPAPAEQLGAEQLEQSGSLGRDGSFAPFRSDIQISAPSDIPYLPITPS